MTNRIGSKEKKSNTGCYLLIAIVLFSLYTCGSRKRIGATCRDGSSSYSTSSGTCSHHGGVRNWKYEYWWD